MVRLLLTVIVLVFNFQPATIYAKDVFKAADAMEQVLSQFIRPGYKKLHEKSVALSAATDELCATANTSTLAKAQQQFSQLVDAWGNIEMIRFGPILGDNNIERMFFFPDRRGKGLKRIRRLIAEQDEKTHDPVQLAKISVAAQGMSAMEYVLFGAGSEQLAQTSGEFRCGYGRSVISNILAITKNLDTQWSGTPEFLYLWGKPGYRNPVFAKDEAAIQHLISTIVHGLEVVRDVRLAAFLKDQPDDDRPKSAPLWRSNNTMRLVFANINSVEKIYRTSNIQSFLPIESTYVANLVADRFVELRDIVSSDLIIADALGNPNSRAKLGKLYSKVDGLINLLDQDFAGSMGMTLGFFFDDGD